MRPKTREQKHIYQKKCLDAIRQFEDREEYCTLEQISILTGVPREFLLNDQYCRSLITHYAVERIASTRTA